ITFAMNIGLGFSFLENLFYSMEIKNSAVILVRIYSAVPLHVTTCAIIGYFLALSDLCQSKIDRTRLILTAFIVPYLFHGFYDTSLLLGGKFTYLIGPELVLLIFFLEYLIANSVNLPSPADLSRSGISFEDWVTIQRQNQYDRWILHSMGRRNEEYVPFFMLHFSSSKIVYLSLFIFLSLTGYIYGDLIVAEYKLFLKTEEQFTLFFLFPATMAFNLFLIGSINPLYFQYSIIRIPIISDVRIFSGSNFDQVTCMDVSIFNTFLKTLEPMGKGTELKVTFRYTSNESPLITGKVIWENHEDLMQPIGSILRIEGTPRNFKRFIGSYYLFRVLKGIIFNSKLPGFKKIRKLFVKETTVMEDYNFFPAGSIIFKEGDESKKFYVLRKGKIELHRTAKDTKVVLGHIIPGQVFGEMALVEHQPRNETAECMEDCVIAIADTGNLEALIENNPTVSLKLIESLSKRILKAEDSFAQKLEEAREDFHVSLKAIEIYEDIASMMVENSVALLAVGEDGTIEACNMKAVTIFDIPYNRLVGQLISSIIPNFMPFGDPEIIPIRRKKKKEIQVLMEINLSNVKGKIKYFITFDENIK
ncbi:MAG: cyclic nucleotide-binding domain-containing protein, partial [Leptospiraceae bacterium]|nr:cyclic nucleotide-binding domain-containing protein [Leptospiraceae bacterium]